MSFFSVVAPEVWRLIEMRQKGGFTQAQVAERMGVTKGTVSQIDSGQVSGTDVVARYVEAPGGSSVSPVRVAELTATADPHKVARVLVIHDNVIRNSAKLRLSLQGRRFFFGRPGRPPVFIAWRNACPRADVKDRSAWVGTRGGPD
ncbi:helix-turn-helix transcriptional regulator [Streptomyces sp. NPDC006610]|uniref:helix-turn-helix domain-containing protein n=1 Tax=Streptomyces sp. NPDC006610 TaxID=3154584 RepID=UPI0033BB4010